MKYFIFDITNRIFGNIEQFEKLSTNYPSGSLLLVTRKQMTLISGFEGNQTRYIDMSSKDEEILDGKSVSQDILVFDGVDGNYKLVTARILEKLK